MKPTKTRLKITANVRMGSKGSKEPLDFWTLFNKTCKYCQVYYHVYYSAWTTEALDGRAVPKISKRHFFQDIKNSLHQVTQMGLKPHQNFFQTFFSINMVAGGVQSSCILEGATDPLIE